MATENKVILKTYTNVRNEEVIQAGQTITPGECISYHSSGTVEQNPTAGEPLIMVAVEDELQGKTITDTAGVGKRIIGWVPGQGDEAAVRISVPTGGTAWKPTIGDLLRTDTKGSWSVGTVGTDTIVAMVMETLAANIDAGKNARVHVMFV